MSKNHVYWILLTLLLIAFAATACGGTVYKWQDAAGNVHYTDTPPPAGATLLSKPTPTDAAPAEQDKPMLSAPCRPDISAADCELARKAMQRDYEDLVRTAQQAGRESPSSISQAESQRQVAAIWAENCRQAKSMLAVLQRRLSGDAHGGDKLTAEERAAVPAQITEMESRIAHVCR